MKAVKPEHLVLNANLQEFAQRATKPAQTRHGTSLHAATPSLLRSRIIYFII
ncbi:MAG: hypothetical protein RIE73_31040 [Coleofasciculus sp. C1-SOL-03]|jgi:hypothetical protein|uniref:hypothetical protein n=1 Tax=Coleofasciculus sp. C1-SOL-03 TaxID=3069522 RepID=UPI003300B34B